MMEQHYDDKRQEPQVRDVLPMLSRPFMPDNGMQMDPERMAEAGYTCFLDTQHPDRDTPTRWWFNTEENLQKIKIGIEARGFEVIT